MRLRIGFTFIFFLVLSFGRSGVPVPSIVTVDDPYPEAGQTVTFTLIQSGLCPDVCVIPANGTPCMPIALNGTATHVYRAPGNYTVEL